MLLTTRDTAAYLRLSVRAVERLLARGDLPGVKIGGARRVRRDGLERWLDETSGRVPRGTRPGHGRGWLP